MTPFWTPGTSLKPNRNRGHFLRSILRTPRPQRGPLGDPLRCLRTSKSQKKYQKITWNTSLRKTSEKIPIRDPPEPQKVMFYLSKTHVFKDPPCREKVSKMIFKSVQNGPLRGPWGPKSRPGAPPKDERKRNQKKRRKNYRKKTCLSK